MRIFRSLEEVPADFGPTIVSVGNFDGIHCGHLSVLKEVTERARQNHSKAVAVTFEPHPFRILRPDMTPRLITPLAKKEALLAQTGLDALLEIPFTRDFSMTTPEEFARDILAGKLRAKEVRAVRLKLATTALCVSIGTVTTLYLLWRGGVWALDQFVFENEAFAVRDLNIQTDGTIPIAQLRQWAGVKPGDNLLALDLARIKRGSRSGTGLRPQIHRAHHQFEPL